MFGSNSELPHHHKVKSRGMSPFRSREENSPTSSSHDHHHHKHHHAKSKSPMRMRSLSPFGRSDSTGGGAAKKPEVMMCHESAHAIVFRDHLRLARKIIQEVNEEEDEDALDEQEEKGAIFAHKHESGSESSSDSDDNDDEDGEAAAQAYGQMKGTLQQMQKDSIRNSLRSSFRQDANAEVVKEINHLAHDLVPELKSVHVTLNNISERAIEIEGLHAHITPLMDLEYTSKTEFTLLLTKQVDEKEWTEAEQEVYQALQNQQAAVKTIQKAEWPSFLQRFQTPKASTTRGPSQHADMAPKPNEGYPFTSFVTSTSLLPEGAQKMRCYGSEQSYPVGVVFLLPQLEEEEEAKAVLETETWAWPAGYAAKTEFNIDNRGRLINGRKEALVSLQQLRHYNHDYIHSEDHYIAGRIIKGGFNVVPYNELFLRVGGPSRLVHGKDAATGHATKTRTQRSLEKGVGLFAALFIRTTTFGDIINLMRTKARIAHTLGAEYVQDMPLLYLHQEHGVRVFTRRMQWEFWNQASHKLQPFLNPSLAGTVKYHETNEASLQQKLQEQLVLDDIVAVEKSETDASGQQLSHHQWAKIAGGFGITDASFLRLLRHQPNFHQVHDILQEGFAASIRAGDYYTARQLMILYSLANTCHYSADDDDDQNDKEETIIAKLLQTKLHGQSASTYSNFGLLKDPNAKVTILPSPIATKRLRRATNLDGLLVVLGAAQILKTITTTSAQRRTEESYLAVEEWVHHGEESVAFRVASWKEQRADEADSNIAMSSDSKFMAFVTNKSVHNRRKFAQQLRKAAPSEADKFTTVGFLQGVYDIVDHMHSPCMRLELLQYILGLDNRYSVHLIKESIELAATCLSVVS